MTAPDGYRRLTCNAKLTAPDCSCDSLAWSRIASADARYLSAAPAIEATSVYLGALLVVPLYLGGLCTGALRRHDAPLVPASTDVQRRHPALPSRRCYPPRDRSRMADCQARRPVPPAAARGLADRDPARRHCGHRGRVRGDALPGQQRLGERRVVRPGLAGPERLLPRDFLVEHAADCDGEEDGAGEQQPGPGHAG